MSRPPLPDGARRLDLMIRSQEKAERARLAAAAACAAIVSAAAVALLGLSGWFITGAALAGLAGAATAHAFNFLIPSATIRLLAIVRTVSRYGERVLGHDAALRALAALRPQLFAALAAAPPARSLAVARGEASARLVQDVDAIQNRFVRLSAPWGAVAGLLTGGLLALLAGWPVLVAVAAFAAASAAAALTCGRRLADPAGREAQAAMGRLKADFDALHAAAPELKAYGATQWATDRFEDRSRALSAETARLARAGGWVGVLPLFGIALGLPVVLAAAAPASPPLIALALLAFVMTVESASALALAYRQNGAVDAAVLRLGDWMEAAPEADRPLDGSALAFAARMGPIAPPARLAVCGRSGAGKTTLVERLMHLRAPLAGEMSLGGVDAADAPTQAARDRFAYAPQQAQFLNGSIAENLRLARPEAAADDLWAVLEDAGLAERVRRAPGGLDAPVGENGAALSGGERRRLGLARAYLRNAPWLVLDEPTEGLDAETESRVLARLAARLARTGQGLILISHRPAPLVLCEHRLTVLGQDTAGRLMLSATDRENAA